MDLVTLMILQMRDLRTSFLDSGFFKELEERHHAGCRLYVETLDFYVQNIDYTKWPSLSEHAVNSGFLDFSLRSLDSKNKKSYQVAIITLRLCAKVEVTGLEEKYLGHEDFLSAYEEETLIHENELDSLMDDDIKSLRFVANVLAEFHHFVPGKRANMVFTSVMIRVSCGWDSNLETGGDAIPKIKNWQIIYRKESGCQLVRRREIPKVQTATVTLTSSSSSSSSNTLDHDNIITTYSSEEIAPSSTINMDDDDGDTTVGDENDVNNDMEDNHTNDDRITVETATLNEPINDPIMNLQVPQVNCYPQNEHYPIPTFINIIMSEEDLAIERDTKRCRIHIDDNNLLFPYELTSFVTNVCINTNTNINDTYHFSQQVIAQNFSSNNNYNNNNNNNNIGSDSPIDIFQESLSVTENNNNNNNNNNIDDDDDDMTNGELEEDLDDNSDKICHLIKSDNSTVTNITLTPSIFEKAFP